MTIKCPKCKSDNTDTARFCSNCATHLHSEDSAQVSFTKTLETPIEELTTGSTFADRYQIIEELGKGGMGNVYKVLDKETSEKIALKLIRPEIASDKKTIERFRNELTTARKIGHRNVCRMYDLNKEKDIYYITMEFVSGGDLKKLIRRTKYLPVGTALSIAKQICEGLEEAHTLGVIHRDLKPHNVMIDQEGYARIMDFGIARSLKAKGITDAGVMIGTPEYMSPEQVEGKEIDQRSDIYSLGIILYEMATGELPFTGDTTFSIAYKHKNETPLNPKKLNPQIPDTLGQLILKCLAKDREKRFQNVGELNSELIRIEKGITTAEKYPSKKEKKPKKKRNFTQKQLFFYSGVTILSILIILGSFDLVSGGKTVKQLLGLIPKSAEKGIAILPFAVEVGDSDDQAFCNGLVEVITAKLTQLEAFQGSIWVVPSWDVVNLEITNPNRVKRELGVDLAVTGSMRRIENMIQLSLSLIDTNTLLEQGSSLSFTDTTMNLSTWQEDIIVKLTEVLDLSLHQQMPLIWASGETHVPHAYESYLKGLGYIRNHKKSEELDNAIFFLKKAVESDPDSALTYAELGRAFRLKYQFETNPDWLDEAQSNCEIAIQNDNQLGSAHVTLGRIHEGKGKHEEAINEYQKALFIEPKNYNATLFLALAFEYAHRLADAEKTWRKAIKLRPYYSKSFYNIGVFYELHGSPDKAIKMYLKVAEITPGYYPIFYTLGASYDKLGEYELAEAMFRKSITIKPNAPAYSNLGTYYFGRRRYGDSVAMFEEAVKVDEKQYVIWGNLGDGYRKILGNLDKADHAYQRAIQLAMKKLAINPKDEIVRARLARYYAAVGDHKAAEDEVSKVLEIRPKNIEVLFICVQIFEYINNRDRALQVLQTYFENGGSKEWFLSDPDLLKLIKDPKFEQLTKNKD